MPALTRVTIAFSSAESDQKAAASLAEGFSRDGIKVDQASTTGAVLALVEKSPADILVASVRLDRDPEEGLSLVRAVRAKHGNATPGDLSQPPIIVVGEEEKRGAALLAGVNAFMPKPAFVKDIVTLARILAMPREGIEPGWGGELGALHLYYMVRALGVSARTGVLSLLRGGRRGELRFYEGEVTSAQVGTLHGQAAFHQLLLWPEAHFDLRLEKVVRRQQIPLTPAELLLDAEKFLRDFNEMAPGVSPASIYEGVELRPEQAEKIPREAEPIVRLFDGTRSVADVIEDSPVRMPETLRVLRNLIALGAIKKGGAGRSQPDTGAALLAEDWLVGQSAPHKMPQPPLPDPPKREAADDAVPAGDWGNLAAVSGPAGYAPVVPSQSQIGEIVEGPAHGSPAPVDKKEAITDGNGDRAAAEAKRARKNSRTQPETPASKAELVEAETERKPRVKTVSGEMKATVAPVGRDTSKERAVEVASDVPGVVVQQTPRPRASGKFETHEEDFFRQEEHFAKAEPSAAESFDDLDDGHPPPKRGFWARLFRRNSDGVGPLKGPRGR